MAVQLWRENYYLRVKNHELKQEVVETFEYAKGALHQVIDTSKYWVVKAFKMLAEDDVPIYERRLNFHKSFHKATLASEELPVFQKS